MAALGNITTNATDTILPTLKLNYWQQILLATLVGLISITGFIGNSMIIAAVAFSKKLQTSTNVFVTNLSVADLLTSFAYIWFAIGILCNEWPLPRAYWICQVSSFMLYACTGTSMWTLGLIAVNRMTLITKPVWHRRIFTPSWKYVALVLMAWLIPAIGLLIPAATGFVVYGYNNNPNNNRDGFTCAAIDPTDSFVYLQDAGGVMFPLPAIFGSYILIYVHTKKHFAMQRSTIRRQSSLPMIRTPTTSNENTRTTSGLGGSTTDNVTKKPTMAAQMLDRKIKKISKQEIEISKNLFIAAITFVTCFLPYFITWPIRHHFSDEGFIFYYIIMTLCTLSNSSINFIIYASKHPDFKVILRHMMRCSYGDIPQPSPFLKNILFRRAQDQMSSSSSTSNHSGN